MTSSTLPLMRRFTNVISTPSPTLVETTSRSGIDEPEERSHENDVDTIGASNSFLILTRSRKHVQFTQRMRDTASYLLSIFNYAARGDGANATQLE